MLIVEIESSSYIILHITPTKLKLIFCILLSRIQMTLLLCLSTVNLFKNFYSKLIFSVEIFLNSSIYVPSLLFKYMSTTISHIFFPTLLFIFYMPNTSADKIIMTSRNLKLTVCILLLCEFLFLKTYFLSNK